MADSVDRVFGHALNTVNKIRPGSQKPPSADRLALYGLYKQAMEGDVALVADRPKSSQPNVSDYVRREQEKWDAWRANDGLSRTEAKRLYIEKLIDAMHKYASTTAEARELVEELEFVWDQIKNNSQHSASSEHSSPLRRREYLPADEDDEHAGITASTAAMDPSSGHVRPRGKGLRVLSPVSQADEAAAAAEAAADAERNDDDDEFVDAPVSQLDDADMHDVSVIERDELEGGPFVAPPRRVAHARSETRWRRRIEASIVKLTTEIAALREQLESSRYVDQQRRYSFWGWLLRLGWLASQLIVANAVILWIVVLYMRKKEDRRLEGAIRVLLGDAVTQVQKVGHQVKMPALPRIAARKPTSPKG